MTPASKVEIARKNQRYQENRKQNFGKRSYFRYPKDIFDFQKNGQEKCHGACSSINDIGFCGLLTKRL